MVDQQVILKVNLQWKL